MSADSISNKAAKKVVTQLPKSPTLGVSTYAWQPESAPRSADSRESWTMPRIQDEAGRGRFNYNTATPGEILDFNTKYQINQPVATQTAQLPSAVAARNYGSGSGSGSGPTAADTLARDRFNAEQAAAGTAAATALRALQGLQGRLASGGYRGNADALLALIQGRQDAGQASIWDNYNTGVADTNSAYGTESAYANDIYKTGVGNANNTYNTGVGNINSGYDTAQGMVNTGYGDLNKYLNANQINPYANLQQQVSPVNNAMANYLSAYGVSNDPVNQQVQASQMANQQGADSFNQLQQLMSSNQLANNQSNLGLSQMAQNYATTGLGTQRAGYQANADASRTDALNSYQSALNDAMYSANQSRTSGLNSAESARRNALNQLMDSMSGERFGVESDAADRKRQLEESIIGLGGSLDGSMAGSGVDGKTVTPGSASSRAQDVASAADDYPNFKAALAAMNPNYKFTTMAAAKKKFPALAGKF